MDNKFVLNGRPCEFLFNSGRGRQPIRFKYLDTGEAKKCGYDYLERQGIQIPPLQSKAAFRRKTQDEIRVRGWIHPLEGGDDTPFNGRYSQFAGERTREEFEKYARQETERWLRNRSAITNDFVLTFIPAHK